MGQDVAFEYTVRTLQKTDETYAIVVEQAPGHWIAQIRLPDGTFWTMNRSEPKAPVLPKQWVGATQAAAADYAARSEEHTSELQSRLHLVCRLLLEKKKKNKKLRQNNKHSTAR